MIKRWIQHLYHSRVIRFLCIGGIGFITNLVVFYMLRQMLGMTLANIIAYFIAVTTTWSLNRLLTFSSDDPNKAGEWLRYVMVYLVTGCFQVLVFTLLTDEIRDLHQHPVGALAVTAIIIAFVNYAFSKRFVFGGKQQLPENAESALR